MEGLKATWDRWANLNNSVAKYVVPGLLIPFLIVVPGAFILANPGASFLAQITSFHAPLINPEAWGAGLSFWGKSIATAAIGTFEAAASLA